MSARKEGAGEGEGKEREGQDGERKSEKDGWQNRRWIVERVTAGNWKRTEGGGNIK